LKGVLERGKELQKKKKKKGSVVEPTTKKCRTARLEKKGEQKGRVKTVKDISPNAPKKKGRRRRGGKLKLRHGIRLCHEQKD